MAEGELITPRKRSITPALRTRIFLRSKGLCYKCGVPLSAPKADVDALALLFRLKNQDVRLGYYFSHGGKSERAGRAQRRVWEVDHLHPLHLGGPDTEDNMAPICMYCHTQKTMREAIDRGKVRRLNGTTPKPQKSRIPTRGFDKRLTRRFDGTVVKRER